MAQEEYLVKISAKDALEKLRKNLTTSERITVTVCGFEQPDSRTYGRYIDNHTFEVLQRPSHTTGFQHKTVIQVNAKDSDSCSVTLKYKGALFYIIFCLIFIPIIFATSLLYILNSNGYTITTNNVPQYYEGHPYFILLFPLILSVIACVLSYIIHGQIYKTRSYVYQYLSYYFIK